jgi:hypothetical protein
LLLKRRGVQFWKNVLERAGKLFQEAFDKLKIPENVILAPLF